jgi:two-component system CitB family sensor kinase/two-component system sensor histidine kinase DcuS
VQEYSEMLRSQTHEYSNKLNLIAGFIQLGATREALELITRESSDYQDLMNFLNEAVPDPVLSAIILGKFCRAQELKIRFRVDPQSHMADVPGWLNREKIVTILGNLLDNAFDAVQQKEEAGREVRLSMTDLGRDLVFEVEDAGKGIDPETAPRIFERGFSTKILPGRGVGLSLVKNTLADLGGEILLGSSELGGALFTVILPKRSRS